MWANIVEGFRGTARRRKSLAGASEVALQGVQRSVCRARPRQGVRSPLSKFPLYVLGFREWRIRNNHPFQQSLHYEEMCSKPQFGRIPKMDFGIYGRNQRYSVFP